MGRGLTLEEGDKSDKPFVARVSCPFGQQDRVFGVRGYMIFVGIKKDDLRQVSVEV